MRNIGPSLALLALAAVVYPALGQTSLSIQMGKPEKPVVGLPFTADQSVRTLQHLPNGMTLTHQIKGRVYRSADGVERTEGTVVATDPAQTDNTTQVWIVDRVQHTAILLNSKLMTATVTHLPANSTVTVSFLAQPRTSGQTSAQPVKQEAPVTSDLGQRTQDRMPLFGKRITGTIPVGKIGNDQPILVTTDVWVAPQLKLVVNEVDRNPLVGERFFELTNIRSEEPDPRLFEVPGGYTVKDMPATPNGLLPAPTQSAPKTPEQQARQIEEALNNPDPRVKNSIAYALADNNDHLPDAQKLAEQAVQLEEQETADVVSKGDNVKGFKQTVVLSSYWDTVGWVYYRQGKQDKAEAYIRAAWEVKPNPEYGLHLGRIYEAQLRPRDAATIYRMALSAKNSPVWKDLFQTRIAKLGESNSEPLPIEIATPLPSILLHLAPGDAEPLVDILLAHDRPPAVTLLKADSALERSLTPAIQTALAGALPDSGPEKILRRARVSCTSGKTPACALHFLSSDGLKGPALLLPQAIKDGSLTLLSILARLT